MKRVDPWTRPLGRSASLAAAVGLTIAACGPPLQAGYRRAAAEIARRADGAIAPWADDAVRASPPSVAFDELDDDAAVALALWQNPGFRDLVVDLDLAHAALVQAGLLANPSIAVLFPLGPKQLEFAVRVPLEALWLRPKRVEAATADDAAAIDRVVQGALDLVRDTRVACAELRLATARAEVQDALARTAAEIADVADARLRSGDTSELEVASAHANAVLTREDHVRAARDADVARTRLAGLLGLAADAPLRLRPLAPAPSSVPVDRLLAVALDDRPDLRAAEAAIRAAETRSGLSRRAVVTVAGIADANGAGRDGFEMGPGIDVSLPVFDWNQGGVARADAELLRAVRREAALRERVRIEVTEAHVRQARAQEQLVLLGAGVIPELERAVTYAKRAFAAGEVSYLFVLETTAQLLRARLRTVEGEAELARATAELERSIGVQLAAVTS